MQLKLRKIGTSWGVLLPKAIVEPYLESGMIELILPNGEDIIMLAKEEGIIIPKQEPIIMDPRIRQAKDITELNNLELDIPPAEEITPEPPKPPKVQEFPIDPPTPMRAPNSTDLPPGYSVNPVTGEVTEDPLTVPRGTSTPETGTEHTAPPVTYATLPRRDSQPPVADTWPLSSKEATVTIVEEPTEPTLAQLPIEEQERRIQEAISDDLPLPGTKPLPPKTDIRRSITLDKSLVTCPEHNCPITSCGCRL